MHTCRITTGTPVISYCDILKLARGLGTLKPPAVPSLLTSTVPGFGVLHMLQVFRRAQLVFPQPLHVQSPGANMPAPIPMHLNHPASQ